MSRQIGFLDPPGPLLGANTTFFWIFSAATLAMVATSVVLVARETHRTRTVLPVIVFISATLWLPNEPFIDTILGFQYASHAPATLFIEAGRPIPVGALGIGAMFFMFTWVIYRMIIGGVGRAKIVAIAVLAGIIDWPLEMLAIHNRVFQYYGHNPSRILGLPLTSMVQNCFLYVFMASVLVLCAPHLKGWRALLFLPVIPGCYYAVAFVCTWPGYIALHTRADDAIFWPLTILAAVCNAAIPLSLLHIVTPGPADSSTVATPAEQHMQPV